MFSSMLWQPDFFLYFNKTPHFCKRLLLGNRLSTLRDDRMQSSVGCICLVFENLPWFDAISSTEVAMVRVGYGVCGGSKTVCTRTLEGLLSDAGLGLH